MHEHVQAKGSAKRNIPVHNMVLQHFNITVLEKKSNIHNAVGRKIGITPHLMRGLFINLIIAGKMLFLSLMVCVFKLLYIQREEADDEGEKDP